MLNVLYADVESRRRPFTVGSDVAPGTPLIAYGAPAITVTGSGDYDGNAVVVTSGGNSLTLAGGRGGESLDDTEATVTFSGAYYFDVAGATAATTQDTTVYLVEADNTLTLTEGSNVAYGKVVFFRGETSATDTAVTIGEHLG